MSKDTPDPTPTLRALHCSLGGRVIVKVQPDSGQVRIGDKTWTLDASCLAPGDGKWDIMLIDGRGRAVSFNPDHDNPSPEEWDQAAHNNLLEQIHALSQPVKTPPLSWVTLGILGLVVLCVIGAGVKNANDAKAIKHEILNLEIMVATGQVPAGLDTTHFGPSTTPPSSSGSG